MLKKLLIQFLGSRVNNQEQLDAEAWAAQGDWAAALAGWETCIARYNTNAKPSWYAGKANALLQLGRLDEAEVIYRKLSEDQTDSHVGFSGLAQVAQCRQNWETARTRWELCLNRFPKDTQPWWYSDQAHALLQSGRLDEAEVIYRKLSEDQTDSHVGFSGLAQVAQWRQDWRTALARWELCLKRFPKDAQPWWYSAQTDALLQSAQRDETAKINLSPKAATSTTISNQLPEESPLVSVVITTFNVAEYVEKAINSIINQTYSNLEIIIIDDCSNDKTIELINNYNDPRIKLYQNTENAGTYFCKNFGILRSNGEYIAIQDSDDYSNPTRIEKQIQFFQDNPQAVIVKCQYVRVTRTGKILSQPKAAFQASLIRRKVFETMGYYDCVRVAGDDEFDCRAKLVFGRSRVCILPELLYYNLQRKDSLTSTVIIGGRERLSYVENFRNWHNKNKDRIGNLFMGFPCKVNKYKIHNKIKISNKTLKQDRFKKIKTKAEVTTASVVSIKKREHAFKEVVKDIINQVDLLKVYLNDYEAIPSFLINSKIKVYLAKDWAGDIADNGKFYGLENLTGFHITIDDDIKYPDDYVSTLKKKLKQYAYKTVVGVHGITINYDSFKSYYEINSRDVIVYSRKNKTDQVVHLLGTGTVAYHTYLAKIDFNEINRPFMVDIFFGIQMNRKNIPLICISRKENWLSDYEVNETTKIYNSFKSDDSIQSTLVLENIFDKKYLREPLVSATVGKYEVLNKIVDAQLHKIRNLQDTLRTNQEEIENLQHTLSVSQGEIDRDAKTYSHLPKWYCKIGGIFRIFS